MVGLGRSWSVKFGGLLRWHGGKAAAGVLRWGTVICRPHPGLMAPPDSNQKPYRRTSHLEQEGSRLAHAGRARYLPYLPNGPLGATLPGLFGLFCLDQLPMFGKMLFWHEITWNKRLVIQSGLRMSALPRKRLWNYFSRIFEKRCYLLEMFGEM